MGELARESAPERELFEATVTFRLFIYGEATVIGRATSEPTPIDAAGHAAWRADMAACILADDGMDKVTEAGLHGDLIGWSGDVTGLRRVELGEQLAPSWKEHRTDG